MDAGADADDDCGWFGLELDSELDAVEADTEERPGFEVDPDPEEDNV